MDRLMEFTIPILGADVPVVMTTLTGIGLAIFAEAVHTGLGTWFRPLRFLGTLLALALASAFAAELLAFIVQPFSRAGIVSAGADGLIASTAVLGAIGFTYMILKCIIAPAWYRLRDYLHLGL